MSMENFSDADLGFDIVIAKVCPVTLRDDDCECDPALIDCAEVEMECIECPCCRTVMADTRFFNGHYDDCQNDFD